MAKITVEIDNLSPCDCRGCKYFSSVREGYSYKKYCRIFRPYSGRSLTKRLPECVEAEMPTDMHLEALHNLYDFFNNDHRPLTVEEVDELLAAVKNRNAGVTMPKRIQRKRTKGWRMPGNAVYVGRPSKWGNPFVGLDAVEKYREAVSIFPVPKERIEAWKDAGGVTVMLMVLAGRVRPVLDTLRGKDLACWCPLDKPCHADILLQIVNEESNLER